MTKASYPVCTNVKGVPMERITLELDATALYAARFAADARGVPLAEWISAVLRERAVAEAMESHVEHDGPPGWEEETLARAFGEDRDETGRGLDRHPSRP